MTKSQDRRIQELLIELEQEPYRHLYKETLSTPVAETMLSARLYNFLGRSGMHDKTLREIAAISPDAMLEWKNVGVKCVAELLFTLKCARENTGAVMGPSTNVLIDSVPIPKTLQDIITAS